ncbi:hypothetical protein [Amycolatopsis sp. 195334CR]|uniref:hypothetical protein n=1 Tax=Amycolatopsis sp. 195334CR TaxID=2814588 RepID=UPI001A8F7FF4|nr:hypothetical protein [Amycolatopsis sp. 195334CR]MBN6035993.1 hypothetical protein [Amycolatopsis sp. 195334CR]
MADSAAFTLADNWYGGFYELALELGPTSDARLARALTALDEAVAVPGWYGSVDREPQDQAAVGCTFESLQRYQHLRGVVALPDGTPIVCGVVAIREDDGSDWLDFYLPLGALENADPRVGAYPHPFEGEAALAHLAWRRPIDDWLAEIGRRIYARAGFSLGLIGDEVSGRVYAADLAEGPPEPRGIGYLVPAHGDLRYWPGTGSA